MVTPEHARAPRGLSLEQKLPFLITALLVIVLATSLIFAYREMTRSAEVAAGERLQRAARQLATLFQTNLDRRARFMARVAANDTVVRAVTGGSVDSASLRRVLSTLMTAPDTGLPIELWTADGRRVLGLGTEPSSPEGSQRPDNAIPPPSGDSAHFGPMYTSAAGVVFWTTVPVVRDGKSHGYIVSQRRVVRAPATDQVLSEFSGHQQAVYFRNADDSFWASLSGSPVAAPADTGVRVKNAPALRSYDRPGLGRVLATEVPVPGTPWRTVVEAPARQFLASPRTTMARISALSLLLLVIGAMVVWVVSRKLTRPLVELTSAAEALAAGDFSRRVEPRGNDEIARLARSFNQMAVQVHASHARLAEQVEEAEALTEELAETNVQLQETTAEAEEARDAAETARAAEQSANRAKSDFLATMSHEIRTPINAVLGYSELLELGLSGPLTDEQRRQLGRIRASTKHLLGLVSEILDLAKIESRTMRIEQEEAVTGETMDAALSLIRPQAAAKGIALSDRCDGVRHTHYLGDEHRVRQVLTNLLANAVKFTNAGGTITATCAVTDTPPAETGLDAKRPYVALRVSDNGIGIPPEQLDKIFQPFTQAETSQRGAYARERTGAGLGLTISRQLARLMGGEITVASTVGEGSTFTLWIPAPERRASPRTTTPAEVDPAQRRSTVQHRGANGAPLDPAQERRRWSLERIAEGLLNQVRPILRTWSEELRQDDSMPATNQLSSQQLEIHAATLITDIALTLRVFGQATDDLSELVRDGTTILRAIAEQHGAQRYRLGWSESAVEREMRLLEETTIAAVRRLAGADRAAGEEAVLVVGQFIQQATRLSLGAHRMTAGGGGA
jgi:signal transduction histidine kinase